MSPPTRKPFRSSTADSGSRHRGPGATNPYRAIEIRCGRNACSTAQREAGRRYLIADVPRLPLPGCSHEGLCDCRYLHLDDRRQGSRRASESGLPARPHPDVPERRTLVSRRAEDTGEHRVLSTSEDSYYDYVHKKLEE